MILVYKTPYVNKTNLPSSSSEKTREFIPSEQDKFTLLISLSQNEQKSPYAYFLLGFNGMKNCVSVTRFFENTLLSNEGEPSVILGEVYSLGGIEAARDNINSYFSLNIEKYIEFTNSSLASFLELFNNIIFEAPEPINQTDSERDIYIKIDGGRQIFSSVTLIDYLAATAFSGGENQTLYETARAFSEFIRQNHAALSLKEKDAEEYILKNTKNNLSVMDIEKRRDLVSFLLFDSGEGVCILSAEGQSVDLKTAFRIDENCRRKISERYS